MNDSIRRELPARQNHKLENVERVLTPIRSREEWPRQGPPGVPLRRVCVLDTETTGLDADQDRVIEICAAMALVDPVGRIAGIQSIGSALESPGHPLSPEIVKLTGLTDSDLVGQGIDRERLAAFIEHCDCVVAFNAQFDRPFTERLLPQMDARPWGCAMRDAPWRNLGFEPGPQNYLLMQALRYNPAAHRAKDDVLSLVELLDHVCRDGESVMAKVLAAMAAPAYRFEASTAAYGYRHDLKRRGYRWAPAKSHQLWHKTVPAPAFRAEYRWYRQTIGKRPVVVEVPATERFRSDRCWKPTPPKVQVASWRR